MIKKEDNNIIVKSNSIFLFIGIGAGLFSFIGISMVIQMIPSFSEYESADFFGFGFMCFWTLIVLSMSFFSFVEASKKLIISDEGVVCTNFIKKKFFEWYEIQDYGLSYDGQTRGAGNTNTYCLYFSKNLLEIKSKYKKRLSGETVKIRIMGEEYNIVQNEIVPFCKNKITVEPFIPEDKFHII